MGRVLLASPSPSNLPQALALLAGDADDAATLQDCLRDGSLSPEDFIVAVPEGQPAQVLGAMMTQRLGGAQGAVWPPLASDPRLEDPLVAAALQRLAGLGCRVLQAMTPIPSPSGVAALQRAGFRYASDLIFMERDLRGNDATPVPRLKLSPAAGDDLRFAKLILATFDGTRDMPELNGTRNAEEVLAGARAAAKDATPLWWYVHANERPLGVLQLLQHGLEIELLYMGLIPQARGQRLGVELAQQAILEAQRVGGTRLHLSHDARNDSAARVYGQLNFRDVRRRAVWLRISAPQSPLAKGLATSLPESS